ncbi:MAG: hypothetical protein JXD19_08935, partial [Deltaproteobacteria bacterium]|nr:hypothetical protein [Deltaproteobacteria bacterium]
ACMEKFMLGIQHCCNPLHVYCRLIERGLNRRSSIRFSMFYERILYQRLTRLTEKSLSLIRKRKREGSAVS